jgi:histone acetyltransferase 1
MANPEEWGCDANDALKLTLLGPLGANPLAFHPDYTYAIFGDAETIYGYKGLVIDLAFARWDMQGFLKVSWRQKINPSLGIEAEDVADILKEYLPEGTTATTSRLLMGDVFHDENDFHMYLANPSFTPPGQIIDSYVVNSNTYSVYKSSLQDPNTIALVNRLQLFVLLLIEGGSFIDISDDRWQIYVLYTTGDDNSDD